MATAKRFIHLMMPRLALVLHAPPVMKQKSIVLVLAIAAAGCRSTNVPLPPMPATMMSDPIARGEYIVRNAAVCGGCHAAEGHKNVDGPLSGGQEFKNWRIGTIRASNLTPDPETGLGNWTDAEIARSLRNGVDDEGHLLAPVMPYEWLHEMSDEDAFAVARYLKSLPPVRNEVKQNPNFMFKLGRALFLGPKPAMSVTTPPRGVTPEYGGYLAQHVGLCADCHTPRGGLLQKPIKDRLFAGDANSNFPAKPSNLTPDNETGIGLWSEDDFLRTLRTGKSPDGDQLHPFMPWPQIARMTDDDLRAIYRYLRTLQPIRNAVP